MIATAFDQYRTWPESRFAAAGVENVLQVI